MSKSVLVTGATGKTGSEVVKGLIARGETVKAGAHTPEKAREMFGAHAGVQVVPLDFGRPETFDAALAAVDRIWLLAVTGDTAPDQALMPFVDRAKAAGVRHIVYMTARGVEMDETNPLRQVEHYIEKSGIGYTFLRPSWFMQNFSSGFIAPMITGMGGIYLPAADAKTSFIDARDIAAVGIAALTEPGHHGKAYALTSGQAWTYGEAAEILSRAAGKPIRYVALSDEDFRNSLTSQGWKPEQVAMFSNLFSGVRQGWAAAVSPDVAHVLGRPQITLEQFAQDHAAVWR
ncbi:MAG: SDR family oxidoreductase [Anaerolineae bacterium]|jgi:uncharacterized protein YbjT (DUF2867 family)|nr:SDR family oxidoreductase [Anaerolineae bacterium]